MTSFVLLSLAMAVLAGAWLSHPLWSAQRRGVFAWRETSRPRMPASFDALRVPAAVTLLAAAAALGGYSLHEAPDGRSEAAAAAATPRRAPLDARSAVPEAPDARTAALADRLAERLKGDVDDADGWYMLGRSYASLGRHAQALGAFRQAARLRPEDASLLTEWAFSAAVIRDRGGSDDPERLVEQALRIDPRDPKALALAGTLALDRRDYATAIDYWEQLAKVEPSDSPIGRQIQASIAQLRQRAAAQAIPLTIAGAPAAGATPTRAVSGVVLLAPALRGRLAGDDTVLVYARSPAGPRVPLALLRRQVKDLPLRFTLDDSLAPTPTARLSTATRVIVGARVEKAGRAVADSELQAQLADVPLGSRDLRIEIGEALRTR